MDNKSALQTPDTRHRDAGSTGTGKSWLSCALGNQAAREGYSVLYTRLSRLLDDFAVARLGNGVGRLMRKVTKVSVLILDDWAMIDLTAAQRRDLMEIVDDRHDRGSIILASQLPVESWHATIGDPTYADAILDRVVHNAIRLPLKGESRIPCSASLDGASSARATLRPAHEQLILTAFCAAHGNLMACPPCLRSRLPLWHRSSRQRFFSCTKSADW